MRQSLLASLAMTLWLAAGPAVAETYSWTQYGPSGLEARAVTDSPACPAARIGGRDLAMTRRAEPGSDYPVLACSLPVPAGTTSASVGGAGLKLPVADPKRILVIGDTGCRLKGAFVQACDDPAAWPFRTVAATAAAMQPDLVIHVGDYHYRETACPAGNRGCAGSPFGDTWAVWRADFFAPAAALLQAAPWVLVRGNHEECNRGGKGWSRTLDPYKFDAPNGCNQPGRIYAVPLPGLTLAIMDVSTADEDTVSEPQRPRYQAQFQWLAHLPAPVWLLLHRPIWSVDGMRNGQPFGANRTLAAAASGAIPPPVQMMLSGHHHTFQVFHYDADLPPQIVSGQGGDYLSQGAPADPAGMDLLGVRVRSGVNVPRSFGFTIFDREDSGGHDGGAWRVTDYDTRGTALRTCTLAARAVGCAAGITPK